MRFQSRSSEVNVHSAFHVSRLFKVGRGVINRDALFCPKTSMYDNSQPHHCNTISVETTISRSLFCWSSLAFFLVFHLINTLLSFCFISTQSEHLSLSLMPNVWALNPIFFEVIYSGICEIQWHDSKIRQVYFMSRWKLLLVGSVYMQFCCGRRSACRRVPVGCSWDSCWL